VYGRTTMKGETAGVSKWTFEAFLETTLHKKATLCHFLADIRHLTL